MQKNHAFKKFLKFIKDQLIVCSVYWLLFYIILRIVACGHWDKLV